MICTLMHVPQPRAAELLRELNTSHDWMLPEDDNDGFSMEDVAGEAQGLGLRAYGIGFRVLFWVKGFSVEDMAGEA